MTLIDEHGDPLDVRATSVVGDGADAGDATSVTLAIRKDETGFTVEDPAAIPAGWWRIEEPDYEAMTVRFVRSPVDS